MPFDKGIAGRVDIIMSQIIDCISNDGTKIVLLGVVTLKTKSVIIIEILPAFSRQSRILRDGKVCIVDGVIKISKQGLHNQCVKKYRFFNHPQAYRRSVLLCA